MTVVASTSGGHKITGLMETPDYVVSIPAYDFSDLYFNGV